MFPRAAHWFQLRKIHCQTDALILNYTIICNQQYMASTLKLFTARLYMQHVTGIPSVFVTQIAIKKCVLKTISVLQMCLLGFRKTKIAFLSHLTMQNPHINSGFHISVNLSVAYPHKIVPSLLAPGCNNFRQQS